MRRFSLVLAFALLLLIDIALVPIALFMLFVGGAFSAVGHIHQLLPVTIISVVAASVAMGLTIVAGKALSSGE